MKEKKNKTRIHRMPYLNEINFPKGWPREKKKLWKKAAIKCHKKGIKPDSEEADPIFARYGLKRERKQK